MLVMTDIVPLLGFSGVVAGIILFIYVLKVKSKLRHFILRGYEKWIK
jgi:hypothetical protein